MANISAADVKKLRDITGAGMMDCKKALTEADGDFEKAKDKIRERGLAIANKRADREASEGVVLAMAAKGNTAGVVISLSCETDFVAKNDDFVNLGKAILNVAAENLPADLEALKALNLNGKTVAEAVAERSGVTGEKMELTYYAKMEAPYVVEYIHNGNKLATVIGLNKVVDRQIGRNIAMQVTAMNPIAVDENSVSDEVKEHEFAVNVEKTKAEEIIRAVDIALKKAGLNPNLVDSDEHIESNMSKGWLTADEAAKARQIRETVTAEATANLDKQAKKIEMIAQGRLQKFFKESTLMNQECIFESKVSIAQYLEREEKGLLATGFVRFGLKN